MDKTHSPTARGLTLIELLVVLAVLAIALRLALPSMQDAVSHVGLGSATTEFLADLQLARTESLKRNWRVALCKSADGATCARNGGWEQGWLVFHDDNNNGAVDSGEELISRRGALPVGLRLSGNQNVARYISFAAIGFTKLTNGGFQAGTLTLCQASDQPTAARQVILNALGRPRVQNQTVSQCL